jgi:transcriptional/translational regulatory protein YebC/TACO1
MNDLTCLLKLAKNKKRTSKNIRLYLTLKKAHIFVNNGLIESGFSQPNFIHLKNNRDEILSIFSKMGFLFDEMIRFLLVGHVHDEKSKRLLYMLNLIPLNRKIRLFLDWKIFDEEFTRSLSRLFEVRNGLVHSINTDVEYRKDKVMVLTNKKDYTEFKKDLQKAWEKLLQVYTDQLSKTDWKKIISKIN